MFVSVMVDAHRRFSEARYSGTLRAEDILEFRERGMKEGAFGPASVHLADLSEVEHVDIDSSALSHLAHASPFGAGSRVAFVTSSDLVYGLARLFEVRLEEEGAQTRVFRDMSEARAWLGLSA